MTCLWLLALAHKKENVMNEKKTKNAKKADEIKEVMTEEMRIAVEAMERTMIARKIKVWYPRQYQYNKIF